MSNMFESGLLTCPYFRVFDRVADKQAQEQRAKVSKRELIWIKLK